MYKLVLAVVVTAVALTGVLTVWGCARKPEPVPDIGPMDVVPPPEEIMPAEEPAAEEPAAEEPEAEEEPAAEEGAEAEEAGAEAPAAEELPELPDAP